LAEILEVVDENNQVIGTESRKKVHETGLRHRVVHVLIVNSKNEEILLQQRSEKMDTYPGYYTSAVAGHLEVGEDYLSAAKRELKEEMGFEGTPEKITSVSADETSNAEFVDVFIFKTDEKPVVQEEEISGLKWIKINELKNAIESDSIKLTPMAKVVLKKFLEVQK